MISVIIPTYERPYYLSMALRSLELQSIRKDLFEVVVVRDGGGYDEQYKVIVEKFQRALSLRYINLEKNIGRSKARNLGVQEASKQLICFLDDDDLYKTRFLSRMFWFFVQSKDELVYCDCHFFDSGVDKGIMFQKDFNKQELMNQSYIPLVSVMLPKKLFFEAGGFDVKLDVLEDWDFLRRVSEKTDFERLPEMLVVYNRLKDGKINLVSYDEVRKAIEYIKGKGVQV